MNFQASYQQIETFIKEKINQDISVSYIDENCFQISKTIKLLMMEQEIALTLRATDLQDGVLALVIESGGAMGIASKVIGFLSSLDFISSDEQENLIKVDLKQIPVVQSAINRMTIEKLQLTPEGVSIEVSTGA